MNARFLLFPALCILLLASCASTVARRIEQYPEVFNALSARQKALVERGRVDEGMGRDAVWLAWGSADHVATGSHRGQTYERWSYKGYEPVLGTGNRFSGVAWGSTPFFGGGWFYDSYTLPDPLVNFVPYEARCVEFIGGKVTAWMAGR